MTTSPYTLSGTEFPPRPRTLLVLSDLDAAAADWRSREPMTGSAPGCHNLRLLNQLWRAMCPVGGRDAWHEELGNRAEGDRNAWRHGGRSAEALALRRAVRGLLREARDLVEEV